MTVAETALEKLHRWERHGGLWRLRRLGPDEALVDLCTCHGEVVEQVRGGDAELLTYLRGRPSSEDDRLCRGPAPA